MSKYGPLIEWDGGECPVPPDTQVRCFFRGRAPYVGKAIYPNFSPENKATMWHHAPSGRRHDPAADIIAYQVRLM